MSVGFFFDESSMFSFFNELYHVKKSKINWKQNFFERLEDYISNTFLRGYNIFNVNFLHSFFGVYYIFAAKYAHHNM